MQVTIGQLVAYALILIAAVVAGMVILRKKAPAVVAGVESAVNRAELRVENFTDGELVKMTAAVFAHLSDDSADVAEIAAANAEVAARVAAANDRINQRAAARNKLAAAATGRPAV